MQALETFDVVVVGGGPAGATAAADLAAKGRSVLLLDREGRIKPCGGAIPPRLIRDFAIPDHLLCARIGAARMIPPSDRHVDMPVENDGFVGMVDREVFDEFLRVRAVEQGSVRRNATFESIDRDADGTAIVRYRAKTALPAEQAVRARMVIGADGALSQVGKQAVRGSDRVPFVFAYHEIIRAPEPSKAYDPRRCDVHYDGRFSPISTPGSSRTGRPRASAPAAPTRASRSARPSPTSASISASSSTRRSAARARRSR